MKKIEWILQKQSGVEIMKIKGLRIFEKFDKKIDNINLKICCNLSDEQIKTIKEYIFSVLSNKREVTFVIERDNKNMIKISSLYGKILALNYISELKH